MRFSCYEWSPKRYHPDFSGIASRYSEQKRERLQELRRRKQFESDHAYTLNLDNNLNKALLSKTQELLKLQQARYRHEDELKYKQQLHEERMRQIEDLKEKNNKTRNATRRNIETAKKHLQQKNEKSRIQLQQTLSRSHLKLSHMNQETQHSNTSKKKSIKQMEMQGLQKVNNFFREKNEEYTRMYLQRIKDENRLKKGEQKQIRRFEKQLRVMNKTVETKRHHLNQLEQEIFKLKTNVKVLNSGHRIRKKVKLTEGTEGSRSKEEWTAQLSKLMNPQQ